MKAMNGMMVQMHNMKPTGDADHGFVMLMKHHYQSSIAKARI